MPPPLKYNPRNPLLLTAQLPYQNLRMRRSDHLINISMHHLDSLPPNLVTQLLQLFRALVMPARSDRLQDKAFACEALRILPFLEFLSGEAIAVRGKVALGVWFVEPGFAEETGFHFGELDVGTFGDAGDY